MYPELREMKDKGHASHVSLATEALIKRMKRDYPLLSEQEIELLYFERVRQFECNDGLECLLIYAC
jgi:hypothetical protein